ncbi:hypothetical protein [Parvularcula maris]|uniref:Uncharacterized protein n=1 Tax=Parvularcula maris TaxID=2965077 RepID=A0A9X2L9Z3_9PROT|nr:hypothetical protein [Parvularcula maris]MCQ8185668.1 hypothetical protein [Parvularcula maris]
MGKFFGGLFFLGVIGFVGWIVLMAVSGERFSVSSNPNISPENRSTSRVAVSGHDAARDLDAVLEDALRNAERAAQLAVELNAASERAYEAANSVQTLVSTNQAAAASRATTVAAAQNADRTAALMQTYSEELQARLREAERLANDAEEAAAMVASVENSRVEAQEAALKAQQAQNALEAASRQAILTEQAAERMQANVPVITTEEVIVLEGAEVAEEQDTIIVVPIDELETASPTSPY